MADVLPGALNRTLGAHRADRFSDAGRAALLKASLDELTGRGPEVSGRRACGDTTRAGERADRYAGDLASGV